MNKIAQVTNSLVTHIYDTEKTAEQIASMYAPGLIFVDITSLNPQPKIGWSYTNGLFVAPSEPTKDELLKPIREQRDTLLNDTQYIFQRQVTGTSDQKLPQDEYNKWVKYWQALRDFPATCDITNIQWPVAPNDTTTFYLSDIQSTISVPK